MRSRTVRRRRGFTLVELLVVIAIIGVLVALLLPAVQAAREAARRAQCQDHLKNLSLGCIMHHDTHQIMPSGGWGWMWVGDPDAGAGESQPGNWLFSVLPFIEQPALYALGRDGSATNYASTAQMEGAAQREVAPLPIINCPSRRPAMTYSRHSTYPSKTLNANATDRAVRTDYGGNVGNIAKGTSWAATSFPRTLTAVATYVWPRQTDGVIIQRGEINLRRIEDGTTKTYLVGERYLNPLAHDSGDDLSDNESAYAGMDNDSLQGTCELPLADTPGIPHDGFGSSHPGVWHMAYCDGSVQAMSYDIEPAIHAQLGSRDGGDCGYNGSGL